jgi:hypothetical protein
VMHTEVHSPCTQLPMHPGQVTADTASVPDAAFMP